MSDPPIRVSELPGGENAEVFHGHEHDSGVSFFLSHNGPGSGPELHRHPYEEVFIVQSGEATFTVGDDQIEAGPGDILIVPPNTPHKFLVTSDGYSSVNIHPVAEMETEWLE